MRTALNNLRAFFSALGFEGVPEIATAELPAFSLSAHTSALPDAFAPAPVCDTCVRQSEPICVCSFAPASVCVCLCVSMFSYVCVSSCP